MDKSYDVLRGIAIPELLYQGALFSSKFITASAVGNVGNLAKRKFPYAYYCGFNMEK